MSVACFDKLIASCKFRISFELIKAFATCITTRTTSCSGDEVFSCGEDRHIIVNL